MPEANNDNRELAGRAALARRVSGKLDISQEAAGVVLNAVLESMAEELAENDKILLRNFGRFDAIVRAPRPVPQRDGSTFMLDARWSVKFKPSHILLKKITP